MNVIINGTFDVLHDGHLKLIRHGRLLADSYTSMRSGSEGSTLLIAIDSDRRVAELKGPTRPVNSASERSNMLSELRSVDRVVIFDNEDELRGIIKSLQPVVMVKGSEYQGQRIVGEDLVDQVYFVQRSAHSSTKLINHEHLVDR